MKKDFPHQTPHSLPKTGLARRTDIPVVGGECPPGWLHDCWVSVEAAEECRSQRQDSGSAQLQLQLQLPNTSMSEGNMMNSRLRPWSREEEIAVLASTEVGT